MIELLLLDLDGVVILELTPPHVIEMEIILLHELLDDLLSQIGIPVVILTHRSRAEAKLILQSANIRDIAGIIAAEDIFKAALKCKPWRLLRDGLRKSWALKTIEQRYGINRQNIAFIDDRQHILDDMMSNGLGLAILAPSVIAPDGSSLESFDFGQLIDTIKGWDRSKSFVCLNSHHILIEEWRRTGVRTRPIAKHAFNLARYHAGWMRRIWLKFFPRHATPGITSENTHE